MKTLLGASKKSEKKERKGVDLATAVPSIPSIIKPPTALHPAISLSPSSCLDYNVLRNILLPHSLFISLLSRQMVVIGSKQSTPLNHNKPTPPCLHLQSPAFVLITPAFYLPCSVSQLL